ncbi:AraC family transcriptional regulator [uncultured Algibacter sp.]|uniref:helix-turn-helix domain-containing protein n=1 Tax=uncultured Algibacter sp. TaxID=298659 RepID=UPI00261486BC|nr:AraC family transcriptional regulator [uncultured Algibacter sp.]
MDNTSIISITSFIIVMLFLLFAVFLLTVKTTKKLSNKLLAGFLIITAVDISVFFYHNFIALPAVLEMLRIQISAFKDPLLFLYILSVIYSDFKLKAKHAVHLIPWVINITILLPNFFLVSTEAQIAFLSNFNFTTESYYISLIGKIIEVIYIIAEVYYLFRYRKLLLENYTSKEAFYNYHWVKQLIIFILIGQSLTFVKAFIRDSGDFDVDFVNIFRVILLLFGLFFSFWLVFKALLSPKLFRGIGVNLQLSKEMVKQTNSSKDHEQNEQIRHIKSFMAKEEPFLDASLSVQSLSDKLGIPSRELSVLINQELKQHFFDFVNDYRIEKSKKILEDSSKNKLTILEILYEVGFNSKSSFNTAFKKHTGLTPTLYRKTSQNQ